MKFQLNLFGFSGHPNEEPTPQADDHAVELDTGVEQHIIISNEVEIDTETINDDTAEKSTTDDGAGVNKADIEEEIVSCR